MHKFFKSKFSQRKMFANPIFYASVLLVSLVPSLVIRGSSGLSGSTSSENGVAFPVQNVPLSIENESNSASDFTFTRDVDELEPREELTNVRHAFNTPFGQINWKDISGNIYQQNSKLMTKYKDYTLELTLEPGLNKAIKDNLNVQHHIAAGIVIIESSTGRILAISERNGEPGNPLYSKESIVFSARAPAASLMKIVTASAAIEKSNLGPFDEINFHSGCGSLKNQNWLREPRLDNQKLTLARAFGTSCNTVFARVALYFTGLSSLKSYTEKYYFNKPIPSDLLIDTSALVIPSLESATPLEVGELGAGFGASKFSPIHAALLSGAVGNRGVLMAPHIVARAWDKKGALVYTAKPMEIGKVFSTETSRKMLTLMQETIVSGTSRRFFRRKGTSQDRFDIGGKTGTLSDAESRGILYTWFSGLAPLNFNNNVAIGTLVASPQNYVVRASSIAQMSLADYLRLEKSEVVNAGNIKKVE